MNKDRDKEEFDIQIFAATMYTLHEYGHYGDKKTNNGVNSGQNEKNSNDLDESSQKNGPQRKKAVTGHRGTDIEQKILYNYISYPGGGTDQDFYKRNVVIYSSDGRVSKGMRYQILHSARFINRKKQ